MVVVSLVDSHFLPACLSLCVKVFKIDTRNAICVYVFYLHSVYANTGTCAVERDETTKSQHSSRTSKHSIAAGMTAAVGLLWLEGLQVESGSVLWCGPN